jgi:hypothetical protein
MENKDITPTTTNANMKLIGSSGKVYRESLKFNEWTRLILDKKNQETFGNFTQAALIVYGLNEDDPSQYATASVMGSQNFRKLKDIASLTLQKKGVTFGFLMDILMARMATSQSSSWWEITMEMMGYRSRAPINVNQYNNNTYIAINDEQLGQQFKDSGIESLSKEALSQIFVEGDLAGGDEQVPTPPIHQEELRDEHPPA